MKQAYYHASIENFLGDNDDEIIGKLNKAGTSFASQWTITTTSWDSSIQILKNAFLELLELNPSARSWHILFEYEIPRLSSRIDAVIIAKDIIFVIEFKYDRKKYELADIRQAEDYANDLHDFHSESKGRIIAPVLLAPLASSFISEINISHDSLILPCFKANSKNISVIINRIFFNYHDETKPDIDSYRWEQSE